MPAQDRSQPSELEAPLLLIDVRPLGDTHVRMFVTGDIDALSQSAIDTAAFVVLRHHRPREITLDLAGVGFLDASGVSALLRCHATARDLQCALALANLQPPVRHVLRTVGLTAHFGVPDPAPPRPRRTGRHPWLGVFRTSR